MIIFLNSLSGVDIIFFLSLILIIILCVGFYLLIPVINRKQYKEARDNLEKRTKALKENHLTSKNNEKSK